MVTTNRIQLSSFGKRMSFGCWFLFVRNSCHIDLYFPEVNWCNFKSRPSRVSHSFLVCYFHWFVINWMYRNSPPSLLVSICVEFIWFVQPRGKIFSLSLKCLKKAHKSLYSLEWLIIIKKFVCELILVSLCCFSSIYFCFKQYDTNFFLMFQEVKSPKGWMLFKFHARKK